MDDEIVPIDGDNAEMSEAIAQARASIGQFFKAFLSFDPKYSEFLLEVRFEDAPEAEHIWLADLDFKTTPSTGVIANEPGIGTVTYLERVPFLEEQISDWMYRENGKLVGAFTTRLLLRAKSKQSGLIGLLKRTLKM